MCCGRGDAQRQHLSRFHGRRIDGDGALRSGDDGAAEAREECEEDSGPNHSLPATWKVAVRVPCAWVKAMKYDPLDHPLVSSVNGLLLTRPWATASPV